MRCGRDLREWTRKDEIWRENKRKTGKEVCHASAKVNITRELPVTSCHVSVRDLLTEVDKLLPVG